MRAQAASHLDENQWRAGCDGRSRARARHRHIRCAQDACSRSSRRDLEERLQAGIDGEVVVDHPTRIIPSGLRDLAIEAWSTLARMKTPPVFVRSFTAIRRLAAAA